MNNYHKDSFIFFKEVSKRLKKDLTNNDTIQLAFNLALGCERLLKGILYDVNPVYIMMEPDFRHTIQTIYSDKLVAGITKSKELASEPNGNVISFSNSIMKAQFVSQATFDHKNILFSIAKIRDIIAHCELRLLDLNEVKQLLLRDFFTMVSAYSEELDISSNKYFENHEVKLSKMSASLQTDLKQRIELILSTHRKIWADNRANETYVSKKAHQTQITLTGDEIEKVNCPSCSQSAIVYLRRIMEFNPTTMDVHLIGYEAKKLRCHYCKLDTSEPALLDHFGIRGKIFEKPQFCVACGQQIEDSINGLCDFCNVQTAES